MLVISVSCFFLVSIFRSRIFHICTFLHFPIFHSCRPFSFSCFFLPCCFVFHFPFPSFSTPAFLSIIFLSCIFHLPIFVCPDWFFPAFSVDPYFYLQYINYLGTIPNLNIRSTLFAYDTNAFIH